MKISYMTESGTRLALIDYKGKESEKAKFILNGLEEIGYELLDHIGNSEEKTMWFEVMDRQEYDMLNKSYKELKHLLKK